MPEETKSIVKGLISYPEGKIEVTVDYCTDYSPAISIMWWRPESLPVLASCRDQRSILIFWYAAGFLVPVTSLYCVLFSQINFSFLESSEFVSSQKDKPVPSQVWACIRTARIGTWPRKNSSRCEQGSVKKTPPFLYRPSNLLQFLPRSLSHFSTFFFLNINGFTRSKTQCKSR